MGVSRDAGDSREPEVKRRQGVAGLLHERKQVPPETRVHVDRYAVPLAKLEKEEREGGEGEREYENVYVSSTSYKTPTKGRRFLNMGK